MPAGASASIESLALGSSFTSKFGPVTGEARPPEDATGQSAAADEAQVIDPVPGLTATFDDFYLDNVGGVARALALTLGDHELGMEAADEAFTRAYAKWDSIRHFDNPAGWTYRVGLNWGRSWLRRKARALAKRQAIGEIYGVSVLDAEEIRSSVDDLELRNALLELSDEQRSVVVLRYFLDWSTEQTAEALDISTGTVKSRLSRGLDHLRNALTSTEGSNRETTP